MSLMEKEMYQFGPFSLDPSERVISRDGTPLSLTPKVFDTLVCLVRNRGRLLTKDELLKEIWPDTFVEEVNLAVNISTLRKAFGENPQDARYIATVPGHGYRFVAEVQQISAENAWRNEDHSQAGNGSSWQPVPRASGTNGGGPGEASTVLQNTSGMGPAGEPAHELERNSSKANGRGSFVMPPLAEEHRSLKRAIPILLAVLLLTLAVGDLRFAQNRKDFPRANASIAVLPFADLSPGKDQEYFSDGLAEEVINDLAKIPDVRVVARSSAFQFKGKNEDLRSVGRKLGVANILEGSVRRESDRLRIRVDLTRTDDGFQLWSETFDRKVDDIFEVQKEIALAVGSALQVKLLDLDRTAPSAKPHGTNSAAYQAYLQAQYFFGRGADKDNQDKALTFADQAIKLDAKYAPAWALRSSVLTSLVMEAFLDEREGLREAREAADKAIALDPDLAAGYVQRGWVQVFGDWDWQGAEVSLKRAAQLEPGSFAVLKYQSYLSQILGHLDEAIAMQRKAIALDPLRARSYSFLGYQLYCAGRYEDADAAIQKALQVNPQLSPAYSDLGLILLAQGRPQEALKQMDQESSEDWRFWGEALAYHSLGRPQDSDAALKTLIGIREKDWAFQIAQVYAYRGETDKSFEWLNRAYDQHDGGMTAIKLDSLLKGLRKDSRYSQLLKKMHFPT